MSAQAPTSPPPFGAPPWAIGGSYDWWWWNFGRPVGIPYEPPEQSDGALGDWHGVVAPAVAAPGPWKVALATSVLGAMTGWVLDEVAQSVRGKRRR